MSAEPTTRDSDSPVADPDSLAARYGFMAPALVVSWGVLYVAPFVAFDRRIVFEAWYRDRFGVAPWDSDDDVGTFRDVTKGPRGLTAYVLFDPATGRGVLAELSDVARGRLEYAIHFAFPYADAKDPSTESDLDAIAAYLRTLFRRDEKRGGEVLIETNVAVGIASLRLAARWLAPGELSEAVPSVAAAALAIASGDAAAAFDALVDALLMAARARGR